MKLTTTRQTDKATVKIYKAVEIVHKQKATFKGNRLARAEQQRINADKINEYNAKRFESALNETKAQKKRAERKAKRNLKSLR